MPDLATLLADYEREGRCGCAESALARELLQEYAVRIHRAFNDVYGNPPLSEAYISLMKQEEGPLTPERS